MVGFLEEIFRKIRFKVDLIVEYEGKKLLDKQLADLLMLIDREGSILAACKTLKIPYSRAWESLARIERVLGVKIVEAKRGGSKGGGTQLTGFGKNILKHYLEQYSKIGIIEKEYVKPKIPELTIIGSHDVALEKIIEAIKAKGLIKDIEVSWIGSAGGLASIMLGEADVAGVHLYDPETKTYNKPYLKRYWLENKAAIIRGYDRELVFAFRKNIEFKKAEDFFTGRFRLANRVLGSGTRSYLDNLLYKTSLKLKIDPGKIPEIIPGYNTEYKTHYGVVRAIVEGRADVGLTLRYVAEQYGLKYKHVCWEKYDFVVRKNKLNKESVKHFISIIKDEKIKELINSLSGYRIDGNIGEIIYS